MTTYQKATVEVRNTKTGSVGWAVCSYSRTTDGKRMVQVFTGKGKDAYWEAANVEGL